ncbi:GIY-YIG nuclease family protein [Candidatus Omnitrophota bacterium]
MPSPYYFYILKCSDNSLYSGVTNDLDKRLVRHNAGKASKYTRGRRPVKIAYRECHSNLSSARKRECEVKRWSRKKKIELIEGCPSK